MLSSSMWLFAVETHACSLQGRRQRKNEGLLGCLRRVCKASGDGRWPGLQDGFVSPLHHEFAAAIFRVTCAAAGLKKMQGARGK